MKLSIKNASQKTRNALRELQEDLSRNDDCRKINWTLLHVYFLLLGYDSETDDALRQSYNDAIRHLGKEFPDLVVKK